MDSKYYLSEQDVTALKKLAGNVQKNPGRLAHDKAPPIEPLGDEMYIAVPPCNEGIPARNGTTPGSNYCCLFKLVATNPSSGVAGFSYEILPVLSVGTGSPVREMVYNVYDQPIGPYLPPNEKYIQIKKDKGGKWLAIPPTELSVVASTTTTTPNIYNQQCTTTCKWTWDGSKWTTNGCTTSTTTSTTTTASGTTSTTTTTPQCLCPGTTTTTTTTTPAPCTNCLYPDFCGTTVGQCYYSSCIRSNLPFNSSVLSSCSGSTTTTYACNCGTTSTPGPCCTQPCGGSSFNGGFYCLWTWNGTKWGLDFSSCASCSIPPDTADTCCAWIEPCAWTFPGTIRGSGGGGGGGGGDNLICPGPPGCNEKFLADPCYCYNNPTDAVCCMATDCSAGGSVLCCSWCWSASLGDWVLAPECGGCLTANDLGPLVCEINNITGECTYVRGGSVCPKPNIRPGLTTTNPCLVTNVDFKCCPSNFITQTVPLPYCCLNGTPCTCNEICGVSSTTSTTTTTPPSGPTTTGGPTTTTTINPNYYCGRCYTSSTTTTAPPVSGKCLWQCSAIGGPWVLVTNGCSCSVPCSCNAPFNECRETCQIQQSSCVANTTTT